MNQDPIQSMGDKFIRGLQELPKMRDAAEAAPEAIPEVKSKVANAALDRLKKPQELPALRQDLQTLRGRLAFINSKIANANSVTTFKYKRQIAKITQTLVKINPFLNSIKAPPEPYETPSADKIEKQVYRDLTRQPITVLINGKQEDFVAQSEADLDVLKERLARAINPRNPSSEQAQRAALMIMYACTQNTAMSFMGPVSDATKAAGGLQHTDVVPVIHLDTGKPARVEVRMEGNIQHNRSREDMGHYRIEGNVEIQTNGDIAWAEDAGYNVFLY